MKNNTKILSWIIFALGVSFYFYSYLLQVSPSVMKHELMSEFSIGAARFGNLSAFLSKWREWRDLNSQPSRTWRSGTCCLLGYPYASLFFLFQLYFVLYRFTSGGKPLLFQQFPGAAALGTRDTAFVVAFETIGKIVGLANVVFAGVLALQEIHKVIAGLSVFRP